MNGSGYRKHRGFTTVAAAAVLALAVNSAFAVLVMGGSTAGQRMYDSWNKEARALVASASGAHKACDKG
jgi:hypothetical protein